MEVNIAVAFFGGLVSFFAPCVVPLVPTYIAYVTGISLKDFQEKENRVFRNQIIIHSFLYLLGFSLIFVILGALAGSIGTQLRQFDWYIQRIGGIVIVLFGLETIGIFHLLSFKNKFGFLMPSWVGNTGAFRSFFLGGVFALAWTPCVGAILGAILTLATITGGTFPGATLLFAYSLGISLPFIAVSLTLSQSRKLLVKIEPFLPTLLRISGTFLVLVGFLLLTDTFRFVNAWIFNIAFRLGYTIR